MKVVLSTLWVRRHGDEYDEAPELAAAWTEFDIENWPEGWVRAKADAVASYGEQFRDSREIDMAVDYGAVVASFTPARIAEAIVTTREGS